jgi:hypothetical protein
VKRIPVCSNKGPVLFKWEIKYNYKNIKMGLGHLKNFSQTTEPEELSDSTKIKFVKIMAPGGRVGPQMGKLFLHVLI